MQDIELLELAAKAAGYQVEWVRNSGCFYRCEEEIGREQWDPLEDDGDALRLAVKLSLMLDIYSGVVVGHDHKLALNITDAWHERDSCDSPGAACSEPHGDDPFSATRRAIVGAAAEIGKNS